MDPRLNRKKNQTPDQNFQFVEEMESRETNKPTKVLTCPSFLIETIKSKIKTDLSENKNKPNIEKKFDAHNELLSVICKKHHLPFGFFPKNAFLTQNTPKNATLADEINHQTDISNHIDARHFEGTNWVAYEFQGGLYQLVNIIDTTSTRPLDFEEFKNELQTIELERMKHHLENPQEILEITSLRMDENHRFLQTVKMAGNGSRENGDYKKLFEDDHPVDTELLNFFDRDVYRKQFEYFRNNEFAWDDLMNDTELNTEDMRAFGENQIENNICMDVEETVEEEVEEKIKETNSLEEGEVRTPEFLEELPSVENHENEVPDVKTTDFKVSEVKQSNIKIHELEPDAEMVSMISMIDSTIIPIIDSTIIPTHSSPIKHLTEPTNIEFVFQGIKSPDLTEEFKTVKIEQRIVITDSGIESRSKNNIDKSETSVLVRKGRKSDHSSKTLEFFMERARAQKRNRSEKSGSKFGIKKCSTKRKSTDDDRPDKIDSFSSRNSSRDRSTSRENCTRGVKPFLVRQITTTSDRSDKTKSRENCIRGVKNSRVRQITSASDRSAKIKPRENCTRGVKPFLVRQITTASDRSDKTKSRENCIRGVRDSRVRQKVPASNRKRQDSCDEKRR